MAETKTFYGEWFPWGDRYRIDRPQWSLWLVELRIDLLVTAVWMGSDWYEPDGRTIDSVGPKRLRRICPPGSVLPEPRNIERSEELEDWPWWARTKAGEAWSIMNISDFCPCDSCISGSVRFYPVQPLQNGAFVPVPWSAVEATP